jgi:hypothetical protein
MSATAVTARATPAAPDPVAVYRDDGPLARALGGLLRRVVPLRAAALLFVAAAPLLALAAVGGADVSRPVAGAAVAWAIVLGGASRTRPGSPKQRWMEPPLLRTIEFAGIVWLAALAGSSAYPAAFALLAALAFRHYDLVYRLRHRGVTPAPWINALSGGWDGRLVVLFLLLLAGELETGTYVAAGLLGVAFVCESVAGWRGGEPVADRHGGEDGELA